MNNRGDLVVSITLSLFLSLILILALSQTHIQSLPLPLAAISLSLSFILFLDIYIILKVQILLIRIQRTALFFLRSRVLILKMDMTSWTHSIIVCTSKPIYHSTPNLSILNGKWH